MELQNRIWKYLINRGISEDVLMSHQIRIDKATSQIVIPVHYGDPFRLRICFNKYRRNPFDMDPTKPKYTYDKGSYTRLYNEHVLQSSTSVVICEGELDALALESHGIAAVSSTGGSQSFMADWAHLFNDKEVFICYDKDNAGVAGALKVQSLIPHAKIIWLPELLKGKDVTDYLKQYDIDAFNKLKASAVSWNIPRHHVVFPEHKKDLRQLKAEYSGLIAHYEEQYADATARNEDRYWFPLIITELGRQYQPIARRLAYNDDKRENVTKIARAKSVPIDSFMEFNYAGKCLCPWHNEKTPSLQYYRDTNTLYCFGGCGRKDAIDAYMEKHNVTFSEAINQLNNETN